MAEDFFPISNFGNYEPQGRPIYDPKANSVDEELKKGNIFNPQNNLLKANIDEISIFPRRH